MFVLVPTCIFAPSVFLLEDQSSSSQLPVAHDSTSNDALECLSDSKQVVDTPEDDAAAAGQQAAMDTVAKEHVDNDDNEVPTSEQKDQAQDEPEGVTAENVSPKEEMKEAAVEPSITVAIEPPLTVDVESNQKPLAGATAEEPKELDEAAETAKPALRPPPIAAKLRASSPSDFAHSSVTKTAWPPTERPGNYRYWRLPDIVASTNQPSSGAFKAESFRLSDFVREQDQQSPKPRRDLLRGDTPPARPMVHPLIVHNIDPVVLISNSQATITKTIHEDKLLYKTVQNLVEEVVETSAVDEDKDIEIPVPQYPPSEMSERWSEVQPDEDRTAISEDTSSFAVPSFDQEITEFLNRELANDREAGANNDLLNDADDENDGVADAFEDDAESQLTNVETLPSAVGSTSDQLPNFHAGPPEADRSSELTRARSIDEESKIDEDDKRKVIESIERHQHTLQSQQEELSHLLDNAIRFLKDLDAEIQARAPELSVNITQEPPHTPMNTPNPFEQRLAPQWPDQEVSTATNVAASPEISPAASEVSNILSLGGARSPRRYQGPAEVILAHLRAIGSQDNDDADVYG